MTTSPAIKRVPNVVALLRELVAIPSVNPAFGGGLSPLTGEKRVARFILDQARARGIPGELHEIRPDRPNVFLWLKPRSRVRQRILLAPHLDTVGAAGSWDGLFRPRLKGDRLHGRGACDTKGSVAAMLAAMFQIARRGGRLEHTEILFMGMIDEENAQLGSRAVAGSGMGVDLAIVGEPTRLEVVTAHKGDLWLELETRGKSAHGSNPELGVNAVHRMARAICLLEERYARELGRRAHPLLGRPTINVGTVQGGTQPNVVPSMCRIRIDRRTLPGETEAGVRREIAALLEGEGLRAGFVNVRGAPCPALETDPKLPMVRTLMQTVGQRQPRGVNYFCDAAVLAAAGIPSVVFGPGDIAQAHTADEWISVRSLQKAEALLVQFLRTLG